MSIQQVAVYPNAQEARDVVQKLQHSNVDRDRISVVLADSGEARELLDSGPGSEAEAAKLGADAVIVENIRIIRTIGATTNMYGVAIRRR